MPTLGPHSILPQFIGDFGACSNVIIIVLFSPWGSFRVPPAGWVPFKAFLISAISTIFKLANASPEIISPAGSYDKWAVYPLGFHFIRAFLFTPLASPSNLSPLPGTGSQFSLHPISFGERGVSARSHKYLSRIPDTKDFRDPKEGSGFVSPTHPVFQDAATFQGPESWFSP